MAIGEGVGVTVGSGVGVGAELMSCLKTTEYFWYPCHEF